MACRSVSDPAVVVLLVIGLLVSLRLVASATREKDGRARPERTSLRRQAGKIEHPRTGLIRQRDPPPKTTWPSTASASADNPGAEHKRSARRKTGCKLAAWLPAGESCFAAVSTSWAWATLLPA